MVFVGLDLGRRRMAWHCVDGSGEVVGVGSVSVTPDGLRGLVDRLDGLPLVAVVESMTGAASARPVGGGRVGRADR